MKNYHNLIDQYSDTLLSCSHVVGVGFGPKRKQGEKIGEKAIVILVDQKVPKDELPNKDIVPQKLGSYKTDVVEIGKLEFLGARRKRVRPAQPGVSIGHYKISAGTLGAVVRDKRSGQPLILSNNHVLANLSNGRDGRAQTGDSILQPGKYDNGLQSEDVIAYLERFIPIYSGMGSSSCPLAALAESVVNNVLHFFRPDYSFKLYKEKPKNSVDCALAKPINDDILKEEILGIGEIAGTADYEIGTNVKKSGRTTGVTTGKIKVIDTTVEINMSETESAVFENQFITDPMSSPGDSGSVVLNKENKAVGLLFAGSGYASVCNDIHLVCDALDIRL